MTLKDIHDKLTNGEKRFVVNNDISIYSISLIPRKKEGGKPTVRVNYHLNEQPFSCVFSLEAYEASDLENLIGRFRKVKTRDLRADNTQVASFQQYSEDEIITVKTLINSMPHKWKDIAYQLYVTATRTKGAIVLSAAEFRMPVNHNLCKFNVEKAQRALNIKANPKGTCDTAFVFKIVNQLANAAETHKKKTVLSNKSWFKKNNQVQEEKIADNSKIRDTVNAI